MIKQAQIKKEYLLLIGSVVMLVVCYQLAFKKTFEAWHLHKQLETQLSRSANTNFQPGYSERKSANISRLLNLYKADTVNFRSNIISKISSIAEKENVKLSEVPTDNPELHKEKLVVEKLAFEGDYVPLLKTLNELEKTSGIGLVRSIDIKTINHHSNEKYPKKLILTIQLVTHS